jgi:hypothetical protein
MGVQKATFHLYQELYRLMEEEKELQGGGNPYYKTVIEGLQDEILAGLGSFVNAHWEDTDTAKAYAEMCVDILRIINEDDEAGCSGEVTYQRIIEYLKKRNDGIIGAWVNVYRVTREYGGAEEGGWWYDHYDCVKSRFVPYDDAEQVKASLEEEYKNQAWGNRFSVLGGVEYVVYIEGTAAESETKEKPQYC